MNLDGYASPEEGLASLINDEGGCVSVGIAVGLYRKPKPITPQTMRRLIRCGRVIGYKMADRSYAIPAWQFKPDGGLIDGLATVMRRIRRDLPNTEGLTPFTILLLENPLTGNETPLNALRRGKLAEVLEVVYAAKY